MQRFRGGLEFKAHRVLYRSTLGSRGNKEDEEERERVGVGWGGKGG